MNDVIANWSDVVKGMSKGLNVKWVDPKGNVYSDVIHQYARYGILSIKDGSGKVDIVAAQHLYGRYWYQVGVNGKKTDIVIIFDKKDSTFKKHPNILNDIWISSKKGGKDSVSLDGQGTSLQALDTIGFEIPFLHYTPAASESGHHDNVEGILHIRNEMDETLSTKVMVPVVSHTIRGTKLCFIRGFGKRLIAIDTFVYVVNSLNKKITIDYKTKPLRVFLQERCWHDLPVHNCLILLSETSGFYEKSVGLEKIPTASALDEFSPSLQDINYWKSSWANYANNLFSVPGLESSSNRVIVTNRRRVFLDYNRLENKLLLFISKPHLVEGKSPQGEASSFVSGPVISELNGVEKIEVMPNPSLPGKLPLYKSLKRRFTSQENVQIEISDKDPVVLKVSLQDTSEHIMRINQGRVSMYNMSIPHNDFEEIFNFSSNPDFCSVCTYSYDGSFTMGASEHGFRWPTLILETLERLPVASLTIPWHGDGAGNYSEGFSFISRKAFLQILMGVNSEEITGQNYLSFWVNASLDTARKVAVILGASQLNSEIFDRDDGVKIGAFGSISPSDANFWGGIVGMVVAQKVLTEIFDKVKTYIPNELTSKDSKLTHYVIPSAGYSAGELLRLYTNWWVQKLAGFPRGNFDSPVEWGIPVAASLFQGMIETLKSHGVPTDEIDFRKGFLTLLQYTIDSASRGTQNALLTGSHSGVKVDSDIFSRAIGSRFIGRLPDRVVLPLVQELVSQKLGQRLAHRNVLEDQYRSIYRKENPLWAKLSDASKMLNLGDYWVRGRVTSFLNSIKDLPLLRTESRINRYWILFSRSVKNTLSTISGKLPSEKPSEYALTTQASLDLDKSLSNRIGVDYLSIFIEMMEGKGRASGRAKPSMRWDRNTPDSFKKWITKEPWNPSLFLCQASPDFIQRAARAYELESFGGRLPQEMGTFSSEFQGKIFEITKSMLESATIESDLNVMKTNYRLSSRLYNSIQRSILAYTVESGFFHYLLRYDATGIHKKVKVVDGIEVSYQTMNERGNVKGSSDMMVSALDVIQANFASGNVNRYKGITYRGVNTMVGYAPEILMNEDAQTDMSGYVHSGDLVTNTEMFSTSQSGWMAGSFGSGIDQLQSSTDARQKLVIFGETSFNATPLADLNQAETIYTPGAIFQVNKVEGTSNGNDIGNVVYKSQIDTFDWERNFYYLWIGDIKKIVKTPGMRFPIAMHPLTGITYEIIDGKKVYKPISNYFLGRIISDQEGEFSRWFRPIDSTHSPKVIHDGIYAAWLNREEIIEHINSACANPHHQYFADKYQQSIMSNDEKKDLAGIHKFRRQEEQNAVSFASKAKSILEAPRTNNILTESQKRKLFVWQMANLLRREINLHEITSTDLSGIHKITTKLDFRVNRAYDGVVLSNPSLEQGHTKIDIAYREGSQVIQFYILRRENTESLMGHDNRWEEVRLNQKAFPKLGELENMLHAISISVNDNGYSSISLLPPRVISEMNATAKTRFESLFEKMIELTSFKYDRYQQSLSKAYKEIAKSSEVRELSVPQKMEAHGRPKYLKKVTFGREEAPDLYKSTLKPFKVKGQLIENIYIDEDGRVLMSHIQHNKKVYTPIKLHSSFEHGSQQTVVFQNEDVSATASERFFIWKKRGWDSDELGKISGVSKNWRVKNYIPPHMEKLTILRKDPGGTLLIDDNHNLFLISEATGHEYLPVCLKEGFGNLRKTDSSTLVFRDIKDSDGQTVFVWNESEWKNNTHWSKMTYANFDVLNGKITTHYFIDNSEGKVTVRSFYYDSKNRPVWNHKKINAGETVYAGNTLIYSSEDHNRIPHLKQIPIHRKSIHRNTLAKPGQIESIGSVFINGLDVSIGISSDASVLLFLASDGRLIKISRVDDAGNFHMELYSDSKPVKISVPREDLSIADFTSKRGSSTWFDRSLIINADDSKNPVGRVLTEIIPDKFMLLYELPKPDSYERAFLSIKQDTLFNLNHKRWTWVPIKNPKEETPGNYKLTAYRATEDMIIYWSPKTKKWVSEEVYEMRSADNAQREITYINGEEVEIKPPRTGINTRKVSFFSTKGKALNHINSYGTLLDENKEKTPVFNDHDYSVFSSFPKFSKTLLPSQMDAFLEKLLIVIGQNSIISSKKINKIIERLSQLGIDSASDLYRVKNMRLFLEVLSEFVYSIFENKDSLSIVMRYSSGDVMEVKIADEGLSQAAFQFFLDDDTKRISIGHWENKYLVFKKNNAYTLPGDLKSMFAPTLIPKISFENLPSGQYITVLYAHTPSDTDPNLQKLTIQKVNDVWAYEIDDVKQTSVTDGVSHRFNAWISSDENRAGLFVQKGKTSLTVYKAPHSQFTSHFYCVDLGKRIAYMDPATGWRHTPVTTNATGVREATINGYKVTIGSKGFNTTASASIDESEITGIDRLGTLYDASGKPNHFYDSTLHYLIHEKGFYFGRASGSGNNCLIHSILQTINSQAGEISTIELLNRDKVNIIRSKMMQELNEMRAKKPEVPHLLPSEQIDVSNRYYMEALVRAFRNVPDFPNFDGDTALMVHAKNGTTYQAYGTQKTQKCVHIWYDSSDLNGDGGHFSPILSSDTKWPSYTYLAGDGEYTRVPNLDQALLKFGTTGEHTNLKQEWTSPLGNTYSIATEPDNSFNYSDQVLVQLEGDNISFQAAKNLFLKHPEYSSWVQVIGENTDTRFGPRDGRISTIQRLPFKQGSVRIVMIGHTSNTSDGQIFGDRSLQSLQFVLRDILKHSHAGLVSNLHIDLVGCQLMKLNTSLKDSLVGKLSLTAMKEGARVGIDKSNIFITARKYPVRVGLDGKKQTLNSKGIWVYKEDIAIWQDFYKQTIAWDPRLKTIHIKPLSLQDLGSVTNDTELFLKRSDIQNQYTREHLESLLKLMHNNVRDRIMDTPAPNSAQRNVNEVAAVKTAKTLNLAISWFQKVEQLRKDANLNEDWVPMIKYRESPHLKEIEILFVNKNDGERKWVSTISQHEESPRQSSLPHESNHNGSLSTLPYDPFSKEITSLINDLGKGAVADSETGSISVKDNVSEADSVSSLNAAFMIKTLIDLSNGDHSIKHLSIAMKVQLFAQLSQNGMGLIEDAAKLTLLIRTVSEIGTESLSKLVSLASKVSLGVGLVADGINIITISYELSKATDPAVKANLGTQLGTTVLSSGLTISALVASSVGASVAATILGSIAVPVAGLAIGLPALVQGYVRIRQGFNHVSEFFDKLLDAAEHPEYHKKKGIWVINSDLVVEEIDLAHKKIKYGTKTTNGTIRGTGHTRTCHWDHFFSAPEPGRNDSALDIFKALGLKQQQDIKSNIDSFILPAGITSRYFMTFQQVPGIRSNSARGLRKIRNFYGSRFYWGYYAMPTDWAVYKLKETKVHTNVKVILSDKKTTMFVPSVPDNNYRSYLSYEIQGGFGQYIIILAPHPVNITIKPPTRAKENTNQKNEWIIPMDNVVRESKNNKFGIFKDGFLDAITLNNRRIKVKDQIIDVGSENPDSLTLESSIAESTAKLLFKINLPGQKINPMVIDSMDISDDLIGMVATMIKKYPRINTNYANKLFINGKVSFRNNTSKKHTVRLAGYPVSDSYGKSMKNSVISANQEASDKFREFFGSKKAILEDFFNWFSQFFLANNFTITAIPGQTIFSFYNTDGTNQEYFYSAGKVLVRTPNNWKKDDCNYVIFATEKKLNLSVTPDTKATKITINDSDLKMSIFEKINEITTIITKKISSLTFSEKIWEDIEFSSISGINFIKKKLDIHLNGCESSSFRWSRNGDDVLLIKSKGGATMRFTNAFKLSNKSLVTFHFSKNNEAITFYEFPDKLMIYTDGK